MTGDVVYDIVLWIFVCVDIDIDIDSTGVGVDVNCVRGCELCTCIWT